MALNIRKHQCVSCGGTANVQTDDGFVKVAHCRDCTRKGLIARHIKKMFATITPLAQVQGCTEGCR